MIVQKELWCWTLVWRCTTYQVRETLCSLPTQTLPELGFAQQISCCLDLLSARTNPFWEYYIFFPNVLTKTYPCQNDIKNVYTVYDCWIKRHALYTEIFVILGHMKHFVQYKQIASFPSTKSKSEQLPYTYFCTMTILLKLSLHLDTWHIRSTVKNTMKTGKISLTITVPPSPLTSDINKQLARLTWFSLKKSARFSYHKKFFRQQKFHLKFTARQTSLWYAREYFRNKRKLTW